MSGERQIVGPGQYLERIVVGVFGNKQHGKDTVSNLIVDTMRERAGKRSKRFALADPVKRVAVELLGMPPEVAWGEGVSTAEREHLRLTWSKYGRNGREWLQWVGTELGRDLVDRELWVDRAVDTVVLDDQGVQLFTISDCRFHNERVSLRQKLEARFIRFFTVKVYRPGMPIDMSHPSEAEVANMPAAMFDHFIDNDAGLAELTKRVTALCDELSGLFGMGVTD